MGIEIIMFDEGTGVKRVQTSEGKPVDYEILFEADMPDNDEAFDCFGNKTALPVTQLLNQEEK